MSVETEASASSMSASISSLESTPLVMHRIWFDLRDTETWYAVMKEATTLYGRNGWKGQPRVRRRLEKFVWERNRPENYVWFEVPDPSFATWISVKYSVQVRVDPTQITGK
jgi:hypothetical protein